MAKALVVAEFVTPKNTFLITSKSDYDQRIAGDWSAPNDTDSRAATPVNLVH